MASESREVRAMRNMAWERAKAELKSMLYTFYEEDSAKQFLELSRVTEQFIADVELDGLNE